MLAISSVIPEPEKDNPNSSALGNGHVGKPAPEKDDGGQPAQTLTAVLPRSVVIGLCVASFVLVVVLLSFVIISPSPRFWNSSTRFSICLLAALLIAIFLFAFYPAKVQLTRVAVIDIGVQLTGPIVFFVVILQLLLHFAPLQLDGRMFFLDGAADVETANLKMSFKPENERPIKYYVVPDDSGHLAGVYVQYANNPQKYQIRLEDGFRTTSWLDLDPVQFGHVSSSFTAKK